jgi:hypothetical protein
MEDQAQPKLYRDIPLPHNSLISLNSILTIDLLAP